jgi:hypothetical protein
MLPNARASLRSDSSLAVVFLVNCGAGLAGIEESRQPVAFIVAFRAQPPEGQSHSDEPDIDQPFTVVMRRSAYHGDTEGWPYKCERSSLASVARKNGIPMGA